MNAELRAVSQTTGATPTTFVALTALAMLVLGAITDRVRYFELPGMNSRGGLAFETLVFLAQLFNTFVATSRSTPGRP